MAKVLNVAVLLAGCGHLGGAEIRESVLTLLAIHPVVSITSDAISQKNVNQKVAGNHSPQEPVTIRNEALKLLKRDPSMNLPEHQALRAVFIELSKKKNIWNYIS